MSRIKVLSDTLANQIAAGEVVERPASVVKELVENSIDAGARRISVDIELGGRRLIRIADDGFGMNRDDAVLSFERHATSKIGSLEDLAAISTLGFRGEALASIASVARVELVSKTEDELAANRVLIDGGRLLDVGDAARNTGTTIIVRDLFFNTPARRKFMRAEATENYHLTQIVQHYALANPEIAFTLTNNGREVLRLAPARDLRERAYQIFGASLIESLLPVAGGHEFIAKVSGYVSAPRERRTNRDGQYFFVNGRFVRDKTITGGLLEGFRAVLPHGVYPVAFLFIEIPLVEIDVNVHPAKTEIRFRRSEAVKETIADAVRRALANAGIARQNDRNFEEQKVSPVTSNQHFESVPTQSELSFHIDDAGPKTDQLIDSDAELFDSAELTTAFTGFVESAAERQNPLVGHDDFVANGSATPEDSEARTVDPAVNFEPSVMFPEVNANAPRETLPYLELPPVDSAVKIVKSADVNQFSRSKVKPIGQLHDSFIIAVDDEGMLLVDQHVAHERILFDKYRKKEEERRIESQNLLIPETIDLSPAQSAAFGIVEEHLEALGFGVMRLSGRTIAIKSIPTDLPASQVRNLLAEILDTVDAGKRGAAKSTLRDDIAASLACKAAVKINMKLTPEKMQWLIDRLLTTSSPTTCPHGRPVILRLTMKDIERGFHRT